MKAELNLTGSGSRSFNSGELGELTTQPNAPGDQDNRSAAHGVGQLICSWRDKEVVAKLDGG